MPTPLDMLLGDTLRRLNLAEADIADAWVEGRKLVLQLAGKERGILDARVKVQIPWDGEER